MYLYQQEKRRQDNTIFALTSCTQSAAGAECEAQKTCFRDSNTSHAHKNWAVTYKCRGFQLRHVIHVLSLRIPGRLWPKLRPICWPLTGSHTQIYTTPDRQTDSRHTGTLTGHDTQIYTTPDRQTDRQTDSRHTGTFLGIHRKQLNAISN